MVSKCVTITSRCLFYVEKSFKEFFLRGVLSYFKFYELLQAITVVLKIPLQRRTSVSKLLFDGYSFICSSNF